MLRATRLPLLFCLLMPQDTDEPLPPHPLDRVVELELAAEGPVPFDYEVEFEGTLHVWTTSEVDLSLSVDEWYEQTLLGEDDDSGGGNVPYVRLRVEAGDRLEVFVAGGEDMAGALLLHLIVAPETSATRKAATEGKRAWMRSEQLDDDDIRGGARDQLQQAISKLCATAGANYSDRIADSLWSLGWAADRAGSLADVCHEAWNSTLGHRKRTLPADHPQLLAARLNLAVSMCEIGDLAGARALFESVLEARERTLSANHPDLLRTQVNLAVSMQKMGDQAGARKLYDSVLGAYEQSLNPDDPELLWLRRNLAGSMDQTGDHAGARVLYDSVLKAYARTLPADHPDLLRVQMDLAVSMKHMGDFASARALEETVLAARERTLPPDHSSLLSVRGNLAVSMKQMGDLAGARSLEESVLAAREHKLPAAHPLLLQARNNLANTMYYMGDLAAAHALRRSVVKCREQTLAADHPDLLRAYTNLAVSMKPGDLAGARSLQEVVLAGYESTLFDDHPTLLRARNNLARSRAQMGDLSGTRALVPPLCAGMRARVRSSLALAPRQVRQTVRAEGHRLATLHFITQSAGAELRTAVFELSETMRLAACEAARSLEGHADDPELAPILAKAAELRREQGDLVARTGRENGSPNESATELTRLSLERDRLEREASRLLAERGVVMQPIDINDLEKALSNREAVVGFRRMTHWYQENGVGEILSGGDHLLAHVLSEGESIIRVDLGDATELEALVNAWRAALGAPVLRNIGEELDEEDLEVKAGLILRKRLLDPILAAAGEDVKRLFVCPDDLAYLVPLEALPMNDAGTERLGDRIRIVSEVSFARLMNQEKPVLREPSLLAMGGVNYDAEGSVPEGLVEVAVPMTRGTDVIPERFGVLLQTKIEVEATAILFERAFETKPALLTDKRTTKAALFEAAPGKRYVHLATHGWFAPESIKSTEDYEPNDGSFVRMSVEQRVTGFAPMTLCGLALAGANNGADSLGRVKGILTAEELCTLDLSQCELAVLSACETNVGIRRAGQGIQSLQAALYAAGARTSITSLWKVDDAATRRLMELFYTNLWIEKMPKSEALWSAKVTMREERHPISHWAGWVMSGDPD